MDNRLEYWTEQLASAALPPLEETRQQVTELLNSATSSNADLQQVISRDPGYSLALFRTLNRLPNAPREPVSTLSHALSLLGTEQIARTAGHLPELRHLPTGEPRKALLAGYAQAGHAACYLSDWGHTLGLGNPEELTTAALFHNLAELLLWSQVPRKMEQLRLLTARGQSRGQAELTLFGFELDRLSVALARHWGLPTLLLESLQPIGAFRQRSLMVMLASALARESQQGWYSQPTLDLLELVAELIRTTPDRAVAGMHALAAEAARSLHRLPLPLSVTGLMPGQAERPVRKPVHDPGHSDTALPPAIIPGTRAKSPLIPRQDQSQRLGRLLRDLKSYAGVERIMVALLNGDGAQLQAKYIVGADSSAPLRRFQHPVDGRHLFSMMLKKPQGVWMNSENRQKLLPLLTDEAHNTLNSDGFYMSSIFVKNRPMGILYADRNDPTALDREGFSQFKSIAQRLANELALK